MSIFEKNIQDFGDEELNQRLNTEGADFAGLLSDELTRRTLRSLETTIKKAGEQEEKFSTSFLVLALVQIVIGGAQLGYSLQFGADKRWGIAWVVAVAILIYGIFRTFGFTKKK